MSFADPNPQNSARINIVEYEGQAFKNSTLEDLVFYINSEQKIHIGPYNLGEKSILTLLRDKVFINGNVEVLGELSLSEFLSSNVHAENANIEALEANQAHISELTSSNINIENSVTQNAHTFHLFCESNVSSNLTVTNKLNASNVFIDEASIHNLSSCNITNHELVTDDILSHNITGSNATFGRLNVIDEIVIASGKATFCNVEMKNASLSGKVGFENFIGFGHDAGLADIDLDSNLDLYNSETPETYHIYWGNRSNQGTQGNQNNDDTGLMIEKDILGNLNIQPGKYGNGSNILQLEPSGNLKIPKIDAGDVFVNGNLSVAGPLHFQSNVNIDGALIIESNVSCSGSFSTSSNVTVDGDLDIGSNILCHESVIVDKHLTIIHGDLHVDQNDFHLENGMLNIKNGRVANDLTVEGVAYVNDTLEVQNDLMVHRKANIDTLEVWGNTYLQGDVNHKCFHVNDNGIIGSNVSCSNLTSDSLLSKNTLIVEKDIEFPNSRIVIKDNIIEADSFVSFENTRLQKSLEVVDDIVIEKGDVNILEGKLTGNIETNDISTNNFVFLRGNEGEEDEEGGESEKFAVAYIHDDGVFVGGSLHVNVDLPKYTVDINGDFQCTGPLFVRSKASFDEDLEVGKDMVCLGKISAPSQSLYLHDECLEIKKLVAKERTICGDLHVNSNIDVQGEALFNSIHVNSNIDVQGEALFNTIHVNDNIHIKHDVTVQNNINVHNDLNVEKALLVGGKCVLEDDLYVNSNLTVQNINLDGNLYHDHFKIDKENGVTSTHIITSSNLISKEKLTVENVIEFPHSKININLSSNVIEASHFKSLEDAYFDKSARVMDDVVIEKGDLQLLQGKLTGNIETNDISTNNFVFLRDDESKGSGESGEDEKFAVAYIHDGGFFVGGSLHVNVDLPKHTVDINGDFQCTGPLFAKSNAHVTKDLEVGGNIVCQGSHEIVQDVLISKGSLNIPGQSFYLQNEKLQLKRLDVLEDLIIQKDLSIQKNLNVDNEINFGTVLASINRDFFVDKGNVVANGLMVNEVANIEDLKVKNDIYTEGNIYAKGNNFQVKDSILQARNINVLDSIEVKNDLIMPQNKLTVSNGIVDLDVLKGNNVSIASNIDVQGNGIIHNSLNVNSNMFVVDMDGIHNSGKSTFKDDVKIDQDMYVKGTVNLRELVVLENTHLQGNLFHDVFKIENDVFSVSNIHTSNVEIHGNLMMKNKLVLENGFELSKSDTKFTEDSITSRSFISKGDSHFQKSLKVDEDIVVQRGNVEILTGRLKGDVETSDFVTDGFVFIKELKTNDDNNGTSCGCSDNEPKDSIAIAYIHDDGVFVGGHLHVNVDFPKHVVDIDGDMGLTGPLYVEGLSKIGGHLEVGQDILIHKSQIVQKDLTIAEGDFYALKHGLSLANDTLTLKKLDVLQNGRINNTFDVEGSLTFGTDLISAVNDFSVKDGILKVNTLEVNDASKVANIEVTNELVVNGNIISKDNAFEVKNSLVSAQDIHVSKSAIIDQKLTVENELSVLGSVEVQGSLLLPQNNFSVWNNLVQLHNLEAKHARIGSVHVNDSLSINGDLQVENNAKFQGDIIAQQNGTFKQDLHVEGNITAQQNITAMSDKRLKYDIIKMEGCTDRLENIESYTFKILVDGKEDPKSKTQVGLLAQEVIDTIPEVVTTNKEGIMSVAYGNLVSVLIGALKETNQKVTTLEKKVTDLHEKLTGLQM